jgi:hypothetical protein
LKLLSGVEIQCFSAIFDCFRRRHDSGQVESFCIVMSAISFVRVAAAQPATDRNGRVLFPTLFSKSPAVNGIGHSPVKCVGR